MPGRSKIIINGETYIDLTSDTVTPSDVAAGKTFHQADGDIATGTNTFDSDTSDDTLLVAEALNGKTFHARGAALTGTMPNNGAVTGLIDLKDEVFTIPQGYHDGSGTIKISQTEQSKLISTNIKAGVEILGVTGDYTGEGVTAESKSVTSSFSSQTVLPSEGYDYISQVTVNAMPITEVPNASGGTTVTVG